MSRTCSVLILAIHIHPPSRMRSTRVIAVLLMLLLLLSIRLSIIIIPTSSANRVLDHRVKSFMHASHSSITSRCAVRREVLALRLLRRVRESRLRRWAQSSS
jgi:hypothetical protein